MTTLADFWDLCAAHDWYYENGHQVRYERGHRERSKLRAIAQESAEHASLYTAWGAHKFSGPTWDCPHFERPVRPLTISVFPGPLPTQCPGQLSLFGGSIPIGVK